MGATDLLIGIYNVARCVDDHLVTLDWEGQRAEARHETAWNVVKTHNGSDFPGNRMVSTGGVPGNAYRTNLDFGAVVKCQATAKFIDAGNPLVDDGVCPGSKGFCRTEISNGGIDWITEYERLQMDQSQDWIDGSATTKIVEVDDHLPLYTREFLAQSCYSKHRQLGLSRIQCWRKQPCQKIVSYWWKTKSFLPKL